MELNHERVAAVFMGCFPEVQMQGGALEPLYTPAAEGRLARLLYREDFAASALHEAAHWCIAGLARQKFEDFGYRYIAMPRSAEEQANFFAAEQRTQCLEALFARCAGVSFQPSADNLHADLAAFKQQLVARQGTTRTWLQSAAGHRGRRYAAALNAASSSNFTWEQLDWIT